MQILSIGSDKKLFEAGSQVRERSQAYAACLGELRIVVFTLRAQEFKEFHTDSLHIYPTNSSSKLMYILDAARIAGRLPGDIVTTQDPFESGLAGVLGRGGRPLHVQLHTDPFAPQFTKSSINQIRLFILRIVLKRAARVRVVSSRVAEKLKAKYPRLHISVLPIFVNLERFASLTRTEHPRFKTIVLWIGRFEAEKDPALALEALSVVVKERDNVGLIMLGSGSLQGKLQEIVKEFGLQEHVEFPGWQDPLPYLAQANLVLCTSKYEGYGMSVIEALAAGVPVLSTDVGVAREAGAIITSEKGFAKALQDWVEKGERKGELKNYPYKSFEEYVERYCADILAAKP